MTTALPTNIPDYLEQLRRALAGADPALVQDALYDAEEYLRSEMAENLDRSEADVIAAVASSYGAPEEVADIYRDTEVKVQTALRAPPPRPRKSLAGRFFGIAADPHAYAALFYMVLSLATGLFYFAWVTAGISISAGLSVLIVGIPFLVLFLGSIRMLSLLEGRIVEVMLGERMPRRPLYGNRGKPLLARIKDMFLDPRTWSTVVYFLAMLPLGILYFFLAVSLLAVSVSLILAPLALLPGVHLNVWMFGVDIPAEAAWALPLLSIAGVALLFATLHAARGIGRLHGLFAKNLLVKSAQYA